MKRATKAKQMTIDEARKILGVEKDSAWEVIEKVRWRICFPCSV